MAYEVKGKTTKQLLNIDISDFNRLSQTDLKRIVSRVGNTVNKRISSLEKSNLNTPALSSVLRSGGKISVKDKNINQLRAEFVRAKNFIESETSTKRGYDEFKRDTIRQLNVEGVDEMSDNQFNKLWKVYERLKEMSPEVANKKFKYEIIDRIADEIVNGGRQSAKTITEKIKKELTDIYERQQSDNNDISEFFEFE